MADVKPPPDKKWASLLDNVLVSIVDDDQNEQIYTDYYSNEFSEFHPLLKQAHWGEYTTKPIAQTKWEKEVAFTIASLVLDPEPIAAPKDSDFRPDFKLFDKKSGRWLLLDTGACQSIWPRSDFPLAKLDQSKSLQAVNGSVIETYGTTKIKVDA